VDHKKMPLVFRMQTQLNYYFTTAFTSVVNGGGSCYKTCSLILLQAVRTLLQQRDS